MPLKYSSVRYAFDLLAPVTVYTLNNSISIVTKEPHLYYDATVRHFSLHHLPYAILGILVLLIFVVLPLLLLLVYPFCWFQRFLNLFPVRWHILHTFVDAFQGCYKDGTEPGTRDCRWFASAFLIIRLVLFLIGGLFDAVAFPLVVIMLVLFTILLISIQPFKEKVRHYNKINICFLLLLTHWNMLFFINTSNDPHLKIPVIVIGTITTLLPILYILLIILHWIISHSRLGMALRRRIHFLRHGYTQLE